MTIVTNGKHAFSFRDIFFCDGESFILKTNSQNYLQERDEQRSVVNAVATWQSHKYSFTLLFVRITFPAFIRVKILTEKKKVYIKMGTTLKFRQYFFPLCK